MKITGIILTIIGGLSVFGGLMGTMVGRDPNLSGLIFVVLGIFLITRANKKKREKEEKEQWEKENVNDK